MNKIAIINSSIKNGGVGHYSCDLSNILNAKLYTLIYDKNIDSYPGEKIYSFIPKIPGGYTLNIKFQNILFRKFINKI